MKKDNPRKIKWDNLYPDKKDDNSGILITIVTSELMQKETRQIRIYIKPKDKKRKDVSITTLADFFQHIQNVLYQVCDEIEENEFRKTGRYPKAIVEHCDLVLKNVTLASADVAVALSNTQMGLPLKGFEKTFGEQAISITNEILEVVRENDNIFPDLSPFIADENRRKRILSELDKIWPEENSKYDYQIAVGHQKLHEMRPERKPKIKEALETAITPQDKTIYGRLIVVNYTKKHTCQIETGEGKFDCKYSPILVDLIKTHGNEFVAIAGKLTESKTILIESESNLTKVDAMPLEEISINENSIILKTPIKLTVDFDKENEQYTVENEELNVFAINDDLKEAVESIKEQIGTIWVEFVKEDPDNLTDSAIAFRDTLIDIIGADL
jgi:hypothetical protein